MAEYITDAQSKTERLGLVTVTNCQAGTVQAATDEVLATQHMNTRATGDKTFHLLVSFRAGEKPDTDTLKAIEERICAGLGYGEHQRISAVHHDTDNLHIHIAINKIHPTRNTMHEPFQSYRTLGELCEVLERDYGLEKDNHTPARSIAEGRAADMERHAGVESLVGWIKRECLEEIKAAQSWTELHEALQANGLELRAKGNGFVIEAGDGTQGKASTVARELSKPKLEARFGPFEASPERQAETKAKRQYQKKPVRLRVNTVELYARYKADQQTLAATQRAALDKARQRKTRKVEDAKRSNRLRRATIKVLGENRLNKKLLYAQASKALRAEIDRINPFEAAYAVLAKTMDAQSLRQVQDSIAGKTIKLPEDEARALALRAVQFKQERGRLPSLQAADPWEQKMAEGVAAFARYAAQAKAAQAARSAQAREA